MAKNMGQYGGGGGGANTKVPDMYGSMGWGGCFRDPKHKSNMYTFVQQRGGGCPYFIPNHKSINGTFVLHTFHNKIIKNYEKMTNFHSFYANFYIIFQ